MSAKINKLETLKDLADEHRSVAMNIFKEEGEVRPMLIAYVGDKRILIPLIFGNNEEKSKLLDVVRLILVAEGVTRYTVAFEGWSLDVGGDKEKTIAESKRLYDNGLSYADSPYRKEIFSVMACSYTDRNMVIYDIDESRNLVEKSFQKEGIHLQGNFFELLPPQKPNDQQTFLAKELLKMAQIDISKFGTEETLQ